MFERAGGLLTGALRRGRIADQTKAALVLQTVSAWLVEQWGREIAEIVRPLHIKKKTLTLATLNASFANEIRARQRLLLDCIAERHGRDAVESIRVEL